MVCFGSHQHGTVDSLLDEPRHVRSKAAGGAQPVRDVRNAPLAHHIQPRPELTRGGSVSSKARRCADCSSSAASAGCCGLGVRLLCVSGACRLCVVVRITQRCVLD